MDKPADKSKITSTVAKSEDKSIQITFTIPFSIVKRAQDEVIADYSKEAEIPGFRKGKAPIDKVREKISQNVLTEKSMSKILPKALADAINEHKIKPATYPKFELIKADEGDDWQLRATTCELPEVNLGDYKKIISEASKTKSIWTPEKGLPKDKPKEPTKEEKEQEVIKILLDSIQINIPKVLINEEVDSRLSALLARIEKLGLNFEGYLGSLEKTPEGLRGEYELQAKSSIALELILNAIAEEDKTKIEETQIDEAIKAASADPKLSEKLNTPEQRRLIRSILLRRETLDRLTASI